MRKGPAVSFFLALVCPSVSFSIPQHLAVFNRYSTLQKVLAPTLFHTGQVAHSQCVGASELEAFELPTVFIWGVGESQGDSTRHADGPKQLTGRG